MLIRLALETKTHHPAADADRLGLLDDPNTERYRTFLAAVFGFESRFEAVLAQTPGLDPRVARSRAKTERLRNDLAALDATPSRTAVIPALRSEAEAMGWLYVVERNTLLHGLLRRHLWREIPSVIDRAGSYLAAYETPGAHYRDLGLAIDAAALRATPNEIVDAAHAAFACQRCWFAQTRGPRHRLAS
jgi:heme oxygenase